MKTDDLLGLFFCLAIIGVGIFGVHMAIAGKWSKRSPSEAPSEAPAPLAVLAPMAQHYDIWIGGSICSGQAGSKIFTINGLAAYDGENQYSGYWRAPAKPDDVEATLTTADGRRWKALWAQVDPTTESPQFLIRKPRNHESAPH